MAVANETLRPQASRVSQLEADNERLSDLVAQANGARSLPSDPSEELPRLRGEVARLSRELAGLKADPSYGHSPKAVGHGKNGGSGTFAKAVIGTNGVPEMVAPPSAERRYSGFGSFGGGIGSGGSFGGGFSGNPSSTNN